LSQHVFVRRADFVINFDKFPLNFAASVNDVRCRMWRRAAGFFVQQTVPINYFVIGVRQQREVETRLVFQLVAQELCFVVRVNADGQNFDFVAVLFFE
jgi:hypothetical protein